MIAVMLQQSTKSTGWVRACGRQRRNDSCTQVVLTTALIAASVSALSAVQGPGAIILGGGLALSSTAVAMQARPSRVPRNAPLRGGGSGPLPIDVVLLLLRPQALLYNHLHWCCSY